MIGRDNLYKNKKMFYEYPSNVLIPILEASENVSKRKSNLEVLNLSKYQIFYLDIKNNSIHKEYFQSLNQLQDKFYEVKLDFLCIKSLQIKSFDLFRNSEGMWDKERRKIHSKIIDEVIIKAKKYQ